MGSSIRFRLIPAIYSQFKTTVWNFKPEVYAEDTGLNEYGMRMKQEDIYAEIGPSYKFEIKN